MKKLILLTLAIAALSGCANKIHLVCPDCTVTNDKFVCTGCEMEAYASRYDGDILAVLPPIIKPQK